MYGSNNFGVPATGYSNLNYLGSPQQLTQPYSGAYSYPTPAQQIVRVHGEEGAKAFALGPNSSVLLMDETDNVVWAKVSDGAGYCTLRGFRIIPLEESNVVAEQPKSTEYVSKQDFDELKARFEKLEGELK